MKNCMLLTLDVHNRILVLCTGSTSSYTRADLFSLNWTQNLNNSDKLGVQFTVSKRI